MFELTLSVLTILFKLALCFVPFAVLLLLSKLKHRSSLTASTEKPHKPGI